MLDTKPLIPLFEGLAVDQSAMLMSAFERYSCPSNTMIFEQGDPANYLYLILKGNVSVVYKPYDGPQIVLTHLKEGDVFGWSAVVGTHKYSSGVISTTELETIRLHRDRLLKLMKTDPETSKIIIDRLALNVSPRWKNAHEQIEPLITPERSKYGNP